MKIEIVKTAVSKILGSIDNSSDKLQEICDLLREKKDGSAASAAAGVYASKDQMGKSEPLERATV